MKEYQFDLLFSLPTEQPVPDSHLDNLFEAGCDDALVGTAKIGQIALDFQRAAPDATSAMISAIANVHSAIPEAKLITAGPDLVNLSDIPRLLKDHDISEVSRQAMRKYAMHVTSKVASRFPTEAVATSTPLWHLNDVMRWLLENQKAPSNQNSLELLELASTTRSLNAALEHVRNSPTPFDRAIADLAVA